MEKLVREFNTEVEEYFLYKNFDKILLVGSLRLA